MRTRTTVLQAHSYQWLGTFGHRGNGEYRKELCRAVEAIQSYLQARQLKETCALLRLDGLYGTGAVLDEPLNVALRHALQSVWTPRFASRADPLALAR